MKTYKLFISGRWVSCDTGETFSSRNPATLQTLGFFQKANSGDVKATISAAESAFERWSSCPAPRRGLILLRAAQMLRQRKEELAKLMTQEMGKVLKETRGDVQEAIDTFEYFAGEGRRLLGHTAPSELPDKFCMTTRRPVGVVGLITPWNFPIAIPAWKIAPALICGNTVIFKPSSDTPLCATMLVELLEKAGVPKGVVNLVTGPGGEVGGELVKNRLVRGISFTGNRETGEWITKNAGVKRVGLELGGKNAVIVMDDADLDLAATGIIWGAFGTTGQRCTAASRVIVHEKVRAKLEAELVRRAKKLRIGDGLKETTDMGPLVNEAALEKVQSYVEIGRKEGAKLLCGGKKPQMKGYFFEPTIFGNVDPHMRIAQEEIFGPVLSIIPVRNFEAAIDACNSVEYGLSSAIYTNNLRNAFRAMEKIEAGLTYVNSSTIGSEVHLPFGGVKQSGTAREAGIEGINEFSETKTLYVDYSGKLQRAQIDID